jgi:predicted AAA+ superfamily ATPase
MKDLRVRHMDSRYHFRFKRVKGGKLKWNERLRFKVISLLIRWKAYRGNVVLVIGETRTGKTLLCEYAMPASILNKTGLAIAWKRPYVLSLEDIPKGIFAIDEGMAVDRDSFMDSMRKLIKKRRGFVITFQVLDDVARSGLDSLGCGRYPRTLINLY